MKTAETILSEKGFFVMVHKDQSESVRKVFIDPVVAAMEEYATERIKDMFEFSEWTGKEGIYWRGNRWYYKEKEYSTSELFQYWQNEINGK